MCEPAALFTFREVNPTAPEIRCSHRSRSVSVGKVAAEAWGGEGTGYEEILDSLTCFKYVGKRRTRIQDDSISVEPLDRFSAREQWKNTCDPARQQ